MLTNNQSIEWYNMQLLYNKFTVKQKKHINFPLGGRKAIAHRRNGMCY